MSKAGTFAQGINTTQSHANVLNSPMPIRETVAERLTALATGTVSQVPSPVSAAATSSSNPYQTSIQSPQQQNQGKVLET
jgi:hypothetical protein